MNRIQQPCLALLASIGGLAGPALTQSPVRPLPLTSWRWDASPRAAAASPARESAPVEAPSGPDRALPIEASAQLPMPRLEIEGGPTSAEAGTFAELSFFGSQRGVSDLENGSGQVELQRIGFDASIGRISEESSWAVHMRNEASFYDWQVSGPGFLGGGDPFNDMYLSRFGAETELARDRDLGLFLGTEIALGGEDEASVSDSFQVGALVGARFRASEDLTLELGLAGLTRLEDDPWILPYIGLDWRLSERLRFGAEGSEVHLQFQASERWTLGAEAVYEYRNFRLNEEGPFGSDAAFRDEEIRLGLTAAFAVTPGVTLEAGVARVVWSEFGLHQDGERIGEAEGGKANWIGFGLRASF